MKRNKTILVVLMVCILSLTGCADNIQVTTSLDPVGFWYGLWHGMILPFAWIISLFSDSTAIYAVYNNGGWYDFGFFLGVGSLGGCSTTTRRK
ncbi:MAG: hypothetical protein KAS32_28015 [Candidatus Peribacteraceae bacterium]|nr:hypothetical protein [Candidatus Peribacteraceae bacterium]